MKFLLGVVVGAVFSRPVLTLIDKQFGSSVRPKIADVMYNLAEKAAAEYKSATR